MCLPAIIPDELWGIDREIFKIWCPRANYDENKYMQLCILPRHPLIFSFLWLIFQSEEIVQFSSTFLSKQINDLLSSYPIDVIRSWQFKKDAFIILQLYTTSLFRTKNIQLDARYIGYGVFYIHKWYFYTLLLHQGMELVIKKVA